MLIRVLLLMEPGNLRSRIEGLLGEENTSVGVVATSDEMWPRLRSEEVDILIAHLPRIPGPPEDWVASLRRLPERPEILLLADEEDAHRRANLLAAGAYAVLNARLAPRELEAALRTIVRRMREEATERLKAARLDRWVDLGDFVSNSLAMRQVMATARRVAQSDATILLLGETGVGKERLARAIHRQSRRAAGPFLPLNCGAVPEGLLESELFGYEKGAFTGAARARRGYFELAHGGTLFLDEIGELPPHLQVKLLRTLEDRSVHRLGGERPVEVDVRIMAATNRDLEEDVHARRFRADLFYRLAVVSLTIPPLRERKEDIPALVTGYLEHFRRTFGSPARSVRADALEMLMAYSWPGNVRELINVIERAVLLTQGEEITPLDLPEAIRGEGSPSAGNGRSGLQDPSHLFRKPLKEARRALVEGFERDYLVQLLKETGGRIGLAARRAGINERTLYGLMRRHGLSKEAFR